MIGHSSGLRLSLSLVIVVMVISSPVVMLVNPAIAKTTSAAASSPLPTVSNIPSAPSTIGQDGSDFTTQAALSSLTARPTNNIVNTNSFYDVVFLAASSGAIKTIEVTFPVGTTIPAGAYFNEAEKCVPGSNCTELTGTASKSGQIITYTVTNAVNVPAGTKIRLEFANINNPLNPSATYKVTVTTRNAANTPIDGPTPSTAYTMKQIGVNAIANNVITTPKIADNAVTTSKLADGSITSTKPNEAFMFRNTLLDNPAGNALGWNPDGVAASFDISASAVSSLENAMISIATPNPSGINYSCDVQIVFTGGFHVSCSSAVSPGTELQYLVTNLPEHINNP